MSYPMRTETLARGRVTGAIPYKVPPTDGRRARYAIKRIPLTPEQYDALQAAFELNARTVLRSFFRKSNPKP